MHKCTTSKWACKGAKETVPECFFDCKSDTEGENDAGADGQVVSNRQDPVQLRAVLERALHATQKLLSCYGSSVAPTTVRRLPPREVLYYPATLEVSVTLNTEETCRCPKHCQCRLRGGPVKLKLPIELNPESGQVKVNVFRPTPGISDGRQGGAGVPDAAGDSCKSKKRRSSSSVRKVRWSKEEPRADG
ncbi:uncharacterized protein LOC111073200 [Drosophila obscura]|uniref:uncharacterized protein LOC111073200 n=1 Tax=Drosophila obscura TaxID=7282 RepID=UPI001BB0E418|nr:uncharacterized protein LOC111073200 [Drosophila obscura]